MYYSFTKRLFDLFFSLFGIIILLPLLALISLLIKLDSKGPVIFKQERIGKEMRPFIVFKFRTMGTGSETHGMITLNKDPRITRVGKYLRKTKLDELPQLINVIKGDMSLVGPRPMPKEDIDHYSEEERNLLLLKPGLTSPASIKYSCEEELLPEDISLIKGSYYSLLPKKLANDLAYFKDPSFLGDLHIILATFLLVLCRIPRIFFPKLRQK